MLPEVPAVRLQVLRKLNTQVVRVEMEQILVTLAPEAVVPEGLQVTEILLRMLLPRFRVAVQEEEELMAVLQVVQIRLK